MVVYLDAVMLVNFLVDYFLLIASNRMCGCPPGGLRTLFSALTGGIYGGAAVLHGAGFLRSPVWKTLMLLIMCVIAFGVNGGFFRKTALFTVLSMALAGLALGLGAGKIYGFAAALLLLACLCFLSGQVGFRTFLPVELQYGEVRLKLTALRDTGNTLCDPVSGGQVLVVGPAVARKLLGLTAQQLRNPVESLSCMPGLRLIPFQSVGQPRGMLLAMKIPQVRVGSWKGSRLVAFAPDALGSDGTYQALTGGTV